MANWRLNLIIIVFAIACLNGCDQPTDAVKYIVITPGSGNVGINRTQQYYATVYNYANQVVVKTVTWSVTGGIGTIDATGKLYAGSVVTSGTILAQVEGASTTINVNVTDKGIVSGVVYDANGSKVPNIYVYLNDAPTYNTSSDLNGNYSIESVPIGTHEVKTRESLQYLSASKAISVEAGDTLTQDITLPMRLTAAEDIQSYSGIITVTVTVTNNGSTEATVVRALYTFYDEDGFPLGSNNLILGNILPSKTANGSFTLNIDSYSSYTKTISCSSYY
jgi:hypothetical protein